MTHFGLALPNLKRASEMNINTALAVNLLPGLSLSYLDLQIRIRNFLARNLRKRVRLTFTKACFLFHDECKESVWGDPKDLVLDDYKSDLVLMY